MAPGQIEPVKGKHATEVVSERVKVKHAKEVTSERLKVKGASEEVSDSLNGAAEEVSVFVAEILHVIAPRDPSMPDEDLEILTQRAGYLSPTVILGVIAELSTIMYQLRAWYTEALGCFVLYLLQVVASFPQCPRNPLGGASSDLSLCRILDGVVLLLTGAHEPARVRDVLQTFLSKRFLPRLSLVRFETVLLNMDSSLRKKFSPLCPSLESGDGCLERCLQILRPDEDMLRRITETQATVTELITKVFPGHRADWFGSAVNGFNTHASDIDCVVSPSVLDGFSGDWLAKRRQQKEEAVVSATHLQERLHNDVDVASLGFDVVELVVDARVPVLKCKSREGVAVDISFNNQLPLHNSRLLRAYADLDPRVADLGRLVKWWARCRRVNDAKEGTLSSYSHVLLVIHYLQHVGLVPNLQDRAVFQENGGTDSNLVFGVHDVWFFDPTSAPDELKKSTHDTSHWTLEGLLCGFFHYFAFEFPVHTHVVSIKDPRGRIFKMDHFIANADVHNATEANVERDGGPSVECEVDPEVDIEICEEVLREVELDCAEDSEEQDSGHDTRGPAKEFPMFETEGEDQDAQDDREVGEENPGLDEEGVEQDLEDEMEICDEALAHDAKGACLDGQHGVEVCEEVLWCDVEGVDAHGEDVEVGEGVPECDSESADDDCDEEVLYGKAGAIPFAKDSGTEHVDVACPVREERESTTGVQGACEDGEDVCEPGGKVDGVTADEDPKDARGHRISQEQHAAQYHLGNRLTMCIEDPLERGRTLGMSYQGMERFAYELRRACHILQEVNGVSVDALFDEAAPPPQSLWKLTDQLEFGSMLKVKYRKPQSFYDGAGQASRGHFPGRDRGGHWAEGEPRERQHSERGQVVPVSQKPVFVDSAGRGKGASGKRHRAEEGEPGPRNSDAPKTAPPIGMKTPNSQGASGKGKGGRRVEGGELEPRTENGPSGRVKARGKGSSSEVPVGSSNGARVSQTEPIVPLRPELQKRRWQNKKASAGATEQSRGRGRW